MKAVVRAVSGGTDWFLVELESLLDRLAAEASKSARDILREVGGG